MTPNRNCASPSAIERTRSNWSARSRARCRASSGDEPVQRAHPGVDVVGLRGHRAGGDQLVADQEHPLQQRLGVDQLGGHHVLLEAGQLLRDVADQGPLAARDGRRDGVRQLGRRRGTEPPALDPGQHPGGLDEGRGGVDDRVERAVHGDQEPVADDLVELEEVHVPGRAEQRAVHGDEVVVGVAVHGGDVVALPAGLDDQRVHAQPGEEAVDLLVPDRHVDPDEPVVALEQHDDVVAVMGVGALARPRTARPYAQGVPRRRCRKGPVRTQGSGDTGETGVPNGGRPAAGALGCPR